MLKPTHVRNSSVFEHLLLCVVVTLATVLTWPRIAGASAQGPASEPHKIQVAFDATEGTWMCLDVSPDGKIVVFDLLGHIYSMPVTGGRATPLTEGTSWNMHPRFSPDGQRLLFTSDRSGSNDLWAMTLANEEMQNVSNMDLPVFQGTWTQDGRHVFGTALNMRVRMPVYQFNFYGDKQELIPAGSRRPLSHFEKHPSNGLIYFEHGGGRIYTNGSSIKTYDTKTGETELYILRPGAACNPTLSPDGKQLAYVHRDDRTTVLVVHDLDTRKERVVCRTLDYDRMDDNSFYGSYPNMAWHPDGSEIYIFFAGGINAVDVVTSAVRKVPFVAPVNREIDQTMRFKLDVPDDNAMTRSHRWAQPVPGGILYETLGDLYLKSGNKLKNLTRSRDHETNPVYDAKSNTIYFAGWNDDDLGAIYSMTPSGSRRKKLTSRPSQYGAITVSPDGGRIAFVRGAGSLMNGTRLENQTDFELVTLQKDGSERKVADIRWNRNRYAKRPPTTLFGKDGKIYFTEYVEDALTLKRIDPDGREEQTVYTFSNATRAVLSPTLQWIAFREYHRSFVTPFEFVGKPVTISAADTKGFCQRVDADEDGDFMEWTEDGEALFWTRGKSFFQKSLADILADSTSADKTDLSFEYTLSKPKTTIALRNVRVLTMNPEKEVLEDVTILVRNSRIAAVGRDVAVPATAKVYDLGGRTIMPGMFDAHGHYGSPISALNVIEQHLYGLKANLAYGVTTMYDVYGTTQKDFWVSDMLQSGKLAGPRIYSVGDPMFGTKYRSKMHRPMASAADALEQAQFNKDHGALALKDYSNHTRKGRQNLASASRQLGLNLVTESFGDPEMNLTQIIDGFTGIEHTMGLDALYDDVVRLFAASQIGMTPTLLVVYNGPSGETYFHQSERLWEDQKLLNFFRKEDLLRLRRPRFYWPDDHYSAQMARGLKKLYDAGVLLQMGAHGQMMGLGAHWEMELFTHGDFSPYEAIEIATINGFRHHGLDHELGSIEVGKLADLVILQENPLENIRNTRSVEYVMKNGVLYSGEDAARVYPEPEAAQELYFKKDHSR